MRNKSTVIVLAALFFVFGYYTWEHFSVKKKAREKEINKVSEERKRLLDPAESAQ